MTKLSDIARAMNLSEATVSNAFTGKGRMKPETRDAILACARQMGYQFRTRSVSRIRKRLIVLLEGFDISFITPILTGISREAALHDLNIPIYSMEIPDSEDIRHPDPDRLNQKIDKLLSGLDYEVSGIIYIAHYPRPLDGLLDQLSIPTVFVFCSRDDGKDVVHYDDRQGALLAVNTLLEEGRRHIAMISGPIDSIGMYLRSAGYQKALLEHQLPYDPRLIRVGDWDEQSGYEQTARLLEEGIHFDAVFAQNDYIGVGAARAIREKGLTIPDDISVIGFDDSPVCYQSFPALTSIRPPFSELGRTALRRLMQLLETPGGESGIEHQTLSSHSTLLHCELVRRGTTR